MNERDPWNSYADIESRRTCFVNRPRFVMAARAKRSEESTVMT